MKTTVQYLTELYSIQSRILLISRLSKDAGWFDTAFYLGDKYSNYKEYNHRSMLDCEVVFEWDLDNPEQNRKYADKVMQRLKADKIECAKFDSGNKSTHLHCFINTEKAVNIPALKRQFIRHYAEGLPLPDMQLIASLNHPIRCENGLHEKTGKRKTLITKTSNYPQVAVLKQKIWDMYMTYQEWYSKYKLTSHLSPLNNSEAIKFIMDAKNFNNIKDGRKRSLFILIWTLKSTMDKQALISLLTSWYKYIGGTHFSDKEIAKYVEYYEKKQYSNQFLVNYINDLLIDLNRKDLCIK